MRWVFACTTTLLVMLAAGCGHRAPVGRRKLTAEQVADRAKPATVNIVVEYEATVEVAELDMDTASLIAEAKRRLAGSNPSRENALTTVFNIFLADPGNYLNPNGKSRTAKGKTSSLGSGMVITPDGYVVTNAHVVNPDEEATKTALVASISNLVQEDAGELERGLENLLPGKAVADEAQTRVKKVLAEHYARSARFVEMNRLVSAVVGYTGSGDDVEPKRNPCTVQKVGKPVPGKDVAICKMSGNDFPTLPLAAGLEDGDVRTGADLFIIGYPGALAFDSSFSLRSRLEPTLTVGHVGGIKDVTEGWRAIQTDASISPGNSGGPALNDMGQVVGLATFTVLGERTQNLNFIVSVDVVQEFLRDLQVTPAQSAFTTKYNQALDDYERQDSRKALALFRQLSQDHPESNIVREFVRRLNNGQALPPTTVSASSNPATAPVATSRSAPEHKSNSAKIVFIVIAFLLVIVIAVVIVVNNS